MKIYLDSTINGYELILIKRDRNTGALTIDNTPYTILSPAKASLLYDLDSNHQLLDSVPANIEKVWLAPECILARDEVRKHYTIKRDRQKADASVLSPLPYSKGYTLALRDLLIWDDKKLVISSFIPYPKSERANFLHNFLSHRIGGDHREVSYSTVRTYRNISPVYDELLTGKHSTPIILHTQLQMDNQTPVTIDSLKFLTLTGAEIISSENIKNFRLQLESLTQTNWQQYKGTLSRVFNYARLKGSYNCISYYKKHSSGLPKSLKFLWDELSEQKAFVGEQDLNLYKDWILEILGVSGQGEITTKLSSFFKKSSATGLPVTMITDAFDNQIKLRPKVWKTA